MVELTAEAAYRQAIAAHERAIAPALQRIEERLHDADEAAARPLRAMRTLLASGLFDAGYYLLECPEAASAGMDPLEHYVTRGEAEGRCPNPLFQTQYYRDHAMIGLPPGVGALEHYVVEGERAGKLPHLFFDPRAYLAARPELMPFVDRPLFHFLKCGPAARIDRRQLPGADLALYFLASGDPSYPLMKFKQVLAEKAGIERGFALYRDALRLPDSGAVRRKRVASLRAVAEARGAAFHETAPAGAPFVVAPPRVIGEGNHRPLAGIARSMFVACLVDARIRGHSAFIELDDLALLDFQG